MVALGIQTSGIVWWAATIQAQSDAREARIVRLEEQSVKDRQYRELLARFEERMERVRDDVSDLKESQVNMERMLRNLIQGLPRP
jgi:hypothetical protein